MAKLLMKNNYYIVRGNNIIFKVHRSNIKEISELIGITKISLKDKGVIVFSDTSEPVYFSSRK